MSGARLIVNADDLGLSRGINEAVCTAHRRGILTSASLMAAQLASEQAIEWVAQMPGLGIGVHLNLTAGRPILPPRELPTLVDSNGIFYPQAVLAGKLWRWEVSGAEITAEFTAQIRWLKERGIEPRHADSHQHMHLYPAAVWPFVRALASEEIRCVRSPRCSSWPARRGIGRPHAGGPVRRWLAGAYRSAVQLLPLRRFAMPASRLAFHSSGVQGAGAIRNAWLAALDHLPDGTFELACHPGHSELGFSGSDRIAAQREEEYRCLCDTAIRDAVERNGIRLIRYADLQECPSERHASAEVSAI